MASVLKGRAKQVFRKGNDSFEIECEKKSLAGSVSQRACVFCGSRVVLYPIADAVHLVHGPIGCAVYTWDIRGALSSGPELHRLSFSTDLRENDVIFGGEKKLYSSLISLIEEYSPSAAFVYSTCIVGIIGDDVDAVCNRVEKEKGIPVLSVHSEGFRGTKKDGYKAACDVLFKIISDAVNDSSITKRDKSRPSINILGEFNLAGEAWIIREYYKKMGVDIISVMTGDGRLDEIRASSAADLNVVQCSGSMMPLAEMMEKAFGIPYLKVSYFGIDDMSEALYSVAEFFSADNPDILKKTGNLIRSELQTFLPELSGYMDIVKGKKAGIYVGGAFKAFSLIKALKTLGIEVVLAGSQTGNSEDYMVLKEMCNEDAIIVDDSNPLELAAFIEEKNIDVFIGGVKERPIAYKLGIAFCDHNHERQIPLAGFKGMRNFVREVCRSLMSPVWQLKEPFLNYEEEV